jgi:hypothetical protein
MSSEYLVYYTCTYEHPVDVASTYILVRIDAPPCIYLSKLAKTPIFIPTTNLTNSQSPFSPT